MQEYKDGTCGEMRPLKELFSKLENNPVELAKTSAVHFGTKEELESKKEVVAIVKWYGDTLLEVQNKLDKIIKHFNIYDIIG